MRCSTYALPSTRPSSTTLRHRRRRQRWQLLQQVPQEVPWRLLLLLGRRQEQPPTAVLRQLPVAQPQVLLLEEVVSAVRKFKAITTSAAMAWDVASTSRSDTTTSRVLRDAQ
jgi:hypothetical protein